MTLHRTFVWVGAMVLAGSMVVGCSQGQNVSADNDRPLFMDQAPQADEPRTGQITADMWRYDAGIGDTAQQIGGGQE